MWPPRCPSRMQYVPAAYIDSASCPVLWCSSHKVHQVVEWTLSISEECALRKAPPLNRPPPPSSFFGRTQYTRYVIFLMLKWKIVGARQTMHKIRGVALKYLCIYDRLGRNGLWICGPFLWTSFSAASLKLFVLFAFLYYSLAVGVPSLKRLKLGCD